MKSLITNNIKFYFYGCYLLIDEYFASTLLNKKEGEKIDGVQAAALGALAGLLAQTLTTPVSELFVCNLLE